MGAALNLTPAYGRSVKGTRAYGEKPTSPGTRISTLGAMTINAMLTAMCFEGTLNGQVFLFFLEHFLCPLITADGGGSNGARPRLWKLMLAAACRRCSRSAIHVRHFPPGTSKWNKIEHRMFCHITENWRGRPLTSQKVTDEDMKTLVITRCDFHGEWNYSLAPHLTLAT